MVRSLPVNLGRGVTERNPFSGFLWALIQTVNDMRSLAEIAIR
jgi:hypothetical protein